MELPGGFDPGRLALLVPEPNGTNPDDWNRGLFPSRLPQPIMAWCLLAIWLLPVLVYWLYDQRRKQVSRILETGGEAHPEPRVAEEEDEGEEEPSLHLSVLLASIEHSTPWTEAPHQPPRTQKVQAGGLGVVVRLIAQHHPRGSGQHQLWMVHPMVSGGGMDYGPGEQQPDLQVTVDGQPQRVEVFCHQHPEGGPNVKYLLLRHRLFTDRTWKADPPELYPNPMTKTNVLCFYALWNQAVGQLLRRHRPDVYHCPDFHAALAPWHALAPGSECHPALKVLLVLHNAEYQGSISTDMAFGKKAQRLARIFDVSPEFLQNHMVHDGRLNLLKAGVDFCALRQGGRGVCAVSDHYAEESEQLYDIFWRLPLRGVRGLANPMLEEERARLPLRPAKASLEGLPPVVAQRVSAGEPLEISAEDLPAELRARLQVKGEVCWLHEHLDCLQGVKAAAKARMQRLLGLREDPQARLFVSLGRIVRQKGIDLVAEVAEWLLENYEDAQLVVVGPDEDGFGAYARTRLEALQDGFQGRMFCWFQFWRVPQAFKLAADFCLMPSRDEPFGYVDVEFAWNGAVVVGAQVGGLGKVPGFYYVAQNRESLKRLQRELRSVLAKAVEMARREPARLARMSQEAVRCSFPLARWRRRLLARYDELVALPFPEAAQASPPARVPTGDGTELLGVPLTPSVRREPLGDLEADEPGSPDWSDDSWLVQELSELQLKDRIVKRLADSDLLRSSGAAAAERRRERIDEILEVVGTEEDKRRERERALQGQGSWLSEWLLERTWDVHRIHWVVASGFVLLPVGQLFAWVLATEWGIRSAGLPAWVPKLGGPVDHNALQLSLFVANALPQAGCTLLWAHLCKRHQAKTLLAWAMLLNLVFLFPFILPLRPYFFAALLLMVFAGALASSSVLFVVFNFMMSIRADLSQAALRMGRLEIARSFMSWMVQAFLLFVSPSKVQGTKEEPLPYKVLLCVLPLALLVLFSSLIPGLLVLHAPRPYREDRFPGWGLKLFARKPSFLLLTLSDCLGGLAAYPSSCYVSWWLANGHTEIGLGWASILIAVVFSVSIGLWARALSAASVHGFSLLVAVVVFTPPPSLLRALAMEEVSTLSFLGTSEAAVVLSALTVLFEGVRSSALWAAKIRILGSRWRLLSWGSFGIALQQGCTFLSPIFCELIARVSNNATFLTRNQKELADAMIVSISPLASAQYAVQLLVIFFIHRDLGLLRLRPRADTEAQPPAPAPACRRRPFARRKPVVVAGLLALVVLVASLIVQYTLRVEELPYGAVRRCYNLSNTGERSNKPQAKACSVLFERFDAVEFGINQYGQATTARSRCGQRMRSAGGDTFVLIVGQSCKVMQCGSGDKLHSMVFGNTMEVFSRHCDIYGQNLVIVHLFEWSWDDVAQECRDYLGPAGFDAVQVSPPAEHVLGPMWYTRYQPVSYTLDSRSGTEQEFIHMVSECRKAGVAILVDAIINHMAGPTVIWPEEDVDKECDGQGEKFAECHGWSGTRFGNRLFQHGSVHYMREEFHHYQDNVLSNCAIPPFYNNRHLCDLSSLPDLDTEQLRVQSKIVSFLERLYEIGVTMFRIDAAMCIYPASLARMLEDLPLDYVYQEYYAELFNLEKHTMENALTISPVSDFNFGWQMADILFDYKKNDRWVSRESNFGQLLELGKADGKYPDGVLPVSRGLQFLDNHDQQRERWKPEHGDTPPNATCVWDGSNVKPCRPIYKHGLIYNLAQLFTLAWPRGDSVELMSSFAWTRFAQGPPGTNTTLPKGGKLEHVWRDGHPAGCRTKPDTSPVSEAYDADHERPWVCEHRWEGVAGLVRLRKSFGQGHEVRAQLTNTFSEGPHVAFALDNVAFVALHRGYNMDTQLGSNKTWNLAGLRTGLPPGKYCDLARESRPVPKAGSDGVLHCSHVVLVANGSNISSGHLESGGVLAMHRDYRVQ